MNNPCDITIKQLVHESAQSTSWHTHNQVQLFWVNRGIVVVETEHVRWSVASGCVGFIPAQLSHRTDVVTGIDGFALYCSVNVIGHDLSSPKLVQSNRLMQALLMRIKSFSEPSLSAEQIRLLMVLIDEIRLTESTLFQLPLPKDKRARQLAYQLLDEPQLSTPVVELAPRFGLSPRTLSRLFLFQTGIGFSVWRTQARLLFALKLLEQNLSITRVAQECGYQTTSRFITVFKSHFGVTPKQYREQADS